MGFKYPHSICRSNEINSNYWGISVVGFNCVPLLYGSHLIHFKKKGSNMWYAFNGLNLYALVVCVYSGIRTTKNRMAQDIRDVEERISNKGFNTKNIIPDFVEQAQ